MNKDNSCPRHALDAALVYSLFWPHGLSSLISRVAGPWPPGASLSLCFPPADAIACVFTCCLTWEHATMAPTASWPMAMQDPHRLWEGA